MRKSEGGGAVGKGSPGVFVQEFVHDFGEELVRNEGGVVGVGDDDAGDAFGAAVGMEGVGLGWESA